MYSRQLFIVPSPGRFRSIPSILHIRYFVQLWACLIYTGGSIEDDSTCSPDLSIRFVIPFYKQYLYKDLYLGMHYTQDGILQSFLEALSVRVLVDTGSKRTQFMSKCCYLDWRRQQDFRTHEPASIGSIWSSEFADAISLMCTDACGC